MAQIKDQEQKDYNANLQKEISVMKLPMTDIKYIHIQYIPDLYVTMEDRFAKQWEKSVVNTIETNPAKMKNERDFVRHLIYHGKLFREPCRGFYPQPDDEYFRQNLISTLYWLPSYKLEHLTHQQMLDDWLILSLFEYCPWVWCNMCSNIIPGRECENIWKHLWWGHAEQLILRCHGNQQPQFNHLEKECLKAFQLKSKSGGFYADLGQKISQCGWEN